MSSTMKVVLNNKNKNHKSKKMRKSSQKRSKHKNLIDKITKCRGLIWLISIFSQVQMASRVILTKVVVNLLVVINRSKGCWA